MQVRVIDLDGAVAAQSPLRARIEAGTGTAIDARDLAPALRITARRATIRRLVERLAGGGQEGVTFYGSGDFHHLSAAFLSGLREDVSVIHFDNHPDWVRFPPTFNCGAWVNRALELPHVKRVVTLGPCGGDLAWPEFKTANLAALAAGRLELYPWAHAPSRVWGEHGSGPSHRTEGGFIHWRALEAEDWPGFLDDLIARLPTRAIWITLDKDVLAPAEAVTNWDQGQMPLEHVLAAIARLGARCEIVGADICGDYSPPVFADPFRASLAYFDHPRMAAPSAAALAINAEVNARLLAGFEAVLP